MMTEFLEGRQIIADAVDDNVIARKLTDEERIALKAHADTIRDNWEMVFAEAVFKYAGQSFEALSDLKDGVTTDPKEYYKLWGELKGFMMALQYGGVDARISKSKFEEIDNLIGYGPVMHPSGDQVTGIDGSDEFIVTAANSTVDQYLADLQEVQELVDDFYTLKAKQRDNR